MDSAPDAIEAEAHPKPMGGGLALPLFLISLAVLAQEILLTRLLAYGLWHHITYMVVTSALLAFGLAGTLVAIFPALAGRSQVGARTAFAIHSSLFALTSFVSTYAIGAADLDTSEIFSNRTTFRELFDGVVNELFFLYVLVGLPIFFGGLAVSTALRQAGGKVSKLYFANLVGSSAGCILFLLVLAPLGGPRTLLLTVLLGTAAALLTPARNTFVRFILPGLIALVTAAGFVDSRVQDLLVPPPAPVPSKTINTDLATGATIEMTLWNTLCRLDVLPQKTSETSVRKVVHQDGDAPTFLEPKDHPRALETQVPYIIHPKLQSLMIIGSGGSRELRLAQERGLPRAVGVEINSGTVALVKEHYADYVGYVAQPHLGLLIERLAAWRNTHAADAKATQAYERLITRQKTIHRGRDARDLGRAHLIRFLDELPADSTAKKDAIAVVPALIAEFQTIPDIELVNAEGRAYLAQSDELFDYIQMTGVDTYAALSSGAYVNSESYLYTADAFDDYLSHLNPGGYFSIIRYEFPYPRETMRLFVMAMDALKRRGITDPTKHILVITVGQWGILVVGREPIDETRLPSVRQMVQSAPSTAGTAPALRYDPYEPIKDSRYLEAMVEWREGRGQAFIDSYPFNIAPITDDAPFFYLYHRWPLILRQLAGLDAGPDSQLAKDDPGMTNMGAVPAGLMVLLSLLAQSLLFGLLFVIVPLIVFRGRSLRVPGSFRTSLYFASLGLAFMLLEISLAQQFALFLGHPTLSLGVVLAGMMLFSGLGSLTSGLFPARSIMKVALGLVVFAALSLTALLPIITEAWLRNDEFIRILYAFLVIGPLGFVMGMPMPSGLRILSERGGDLVTWAFGVNGVASVAGSILAVVLAMSIGFQWVMVTAAGLYALAFLCRLR